MLRKLTKGCWFWQNGTLVILTPRINEVNYLSFSIELPQHPVSWCKVEVSVNVFCTGCQAYLCQMFFKYQAFSCRLLSQNLITLK